MLPTAVVFFCNWFSIYGALLGVCFLFYDGNYFPARLLGAACFRVLSVDD